MDVCMKTKLNITIDEALVPKTKAYARTHGVSLSQLIENLLKEKTTQQETSFSANWRGRFLSEEKGGARYKKLKERYSL